MISRKYLFISNLNRINNIVDNILNNTFHILTSIKVNSNLEKWIIVIFLI